MKHLLISALLALLCGCTATGKPRAKAPSPPMPPLPPGWTAERMAAQPKTLRAGLGNGEVFQPASSPPASPRMEIVDWFEFYLVRVEQAPNHATAVYTGESVEAQTFEVASYACNTGGETQWVAASVPKAYPKLFIKGRDEACAGFVPAAAAEPARDLRRKVKFSDGDYWLHELPAQGASRRFLLKKAK